MDERQKLADALRAALEGSFDADKVRKLAVPYRFFKLEPTPQGVVDYCFELCDALTTLPPRDKLSNGAEKRLGGIRKQLGASLSIIRKAHKISENYGIRGEEPGLLTQDEVTAVEQIIEKTIRWHEEAEEMTLIYAREATPTKRPSGRPANEQRNALESCLADVLLTAGLNQQKTAHFISKFIKLHATDRFGMYYMTPPTEEAVKTRLSKRLSAKK